MSQSPPHPTRYMRYVWLVYLGALLFQPLFDPSTDPLDWLVVAVLIAVFLPLYAATFRARSDRQTLILIAALGALALAGSLFNGGASVFVIYAAGVAGRLYPTRRAVGVIAVLVGVVGLMVVISPIPMPWRLVALAPALFFTPVIGATSIFDVERERASQRLLRADAEIERLATIAERERIARDLHDLLGHTLSVIVLKSELAARLITADPDRAVAEVHDIERIGREALGEVRAAVTGYRSRGLGAELDGAGVALQAAGVDVEVHADPTALGPEQESALAMALREAVTNVVRHADAQRATISITTVADKVAQTVVGSGQRGLPDLAFLHLAIAGHHESGEVTPRKPPAQCHADPCRQGMPDGPGGEVHPRHLAHIRVIAQRVAKACVAVQHLFADPAEFLIDREQANRGVPLAHQETVTARVLRIGLVDRHHVIMQRGKSLGGREDRGVVSNLGNLDQADGFQTDELRLGTEVFDLGLGRPMRLPGRRIGQLGVQHRVLSYIIYSFCGHANSGRDRVLAHDQIRGLLPDHDRRRIGIA